MGGATSWDASVELSPLNRMLISLSGPVAGFLFGGIVFLLGSLGLNSAGPISTVYYDLLWVNIGWGIFNLLPMLPLDGGQVLVTLETWLVWKKSQLISHAISLLIALGIVSLALSYRSIWIAILGGWFTYSNGTFVLEKLNEHHDYKLKADFERIRESIDDKEFDYALNVVRRVQKSAHSSRVQRDAAWLLIFILIRQGRYKDAEDELIRYEGRFGEDSYLKGFFFFRQREIAVAIQHLKKGFGHKPSEQTGMLLSQALTKEGRFLELLELIKHPVMDEVRWELSRDLHEDSFSASDFGISAQAGVMSYELSPDPTLAYNIGCAFARGGELDTALHWLERAVQTGFDDKHLMATDSDLESLRNSPSFAVILARLPD
jgi:stage IV sporulation protein FB